MPPRLKTKRFRDSTKTESAGETQRLDRESTREHRGSIKNDGD